MHTIGEQMKSRMLCPKCRLTIFAGSEERLDEIASKIKCYCDKPPEERPDKPIKEYVGKRKIKVSPDNIRLIKDLYE